MAEASLHGRIYGVFGKLNLLPERHYPPLKTFSLAFGENVVALR